MIYSFLYVLIYSCASVFIEKLYFSIPPFFSLMITASIATFFFNLINIGKLKNIYAACWHEKKLWLSIMITILIMWNCTMIGPGMIGASLYNFLYFSWLGMIGFLSLGIFEWKKSRIKFYIGLSILGLIIIALFDQLVRSNSSINIWGILLAITGGSSAFIYFKQSQAIIKRIQLSATQILSIRFYLTILVLFVILPSGSFQTLFTMSNILQLILLAAISLILPLYFQQKALERISSEHNAIILSFSPIATAVLQEIIFKNVELKFVIIYLLYSAIIATSYFLNKYKTRVEKI